MNEPPHGVRLLFSEAELARRVAELAREVAAVMPRDLTLAALLRGSFVFAADLVRALGREGLTPRVDFPPFIGAID